MPFRHCDDHDTMDRGRRARGGGKRTLTTRNIVIAAGARPFVPPIPGLREVNPLTSDTVWDLKALPRRLVVLGGGPIGCELAQCFARLGSEVTQVEMLPRILVREDPEISELVTRRFRAEGIDVLAGHKALRVTVEGGEKTLVVDARGRRTKHRIRRTPVRGGPHTEYRRLRPGGAGNWARGRKNRGDERIPADDLSQHLCVRRRRRAVPVHAYGFTPGVVCRGQCAFRALAEVQGRLFGDSVGDFHRARSRTGGPQRNRSAREEHRVRSDHLRLRRARPRHRRRRSRKAS